MSHTLSLFVALQCSHNDYIIHPAGKTASLRGTLSDFLSAIMYLCCDVAPRNIVLIQRIGGVWGHVIDAINKVGAISGRNNKFAAYIKR